MLPYQDDTSNFMGKILYYMMYNTIMKYITSDPDIMSGKLVITGTRVPVARILFLLKEGYTIEAIKEEYPHVALANIKGAVNELIEKLDNSDYASKIL